VVSRKSETAGSELFWSFDEGSAESGFNMELDVAMEEPDAYARQYLVYFMMIMLHRPGLSALNLTTA